MRRLKAAMDDTAERLASEELTRIRAKHACRVRSAAENGCDWDALPETRASGGYTDATPALGRNDDIKALPKDA
jgi:hypothetical protein